MKKWAIVENEQKVHQKSYFFHFQYVGDWRANNMVLKCRSVCLVNLELNILNDRHNKDMLGMWMWSAFPWEVDFMAYCLEYTRNYHYPSTHHIEESGKDIFLILSLCSTCATKLQFEKKKKKGILTRNIQHCDKRLFCHSAIGIFFCCF